MYHLSYKYFKFRYDSKLVPMYFILTNIIKFSKSMCVCVYYVGIYLCMKFNIEYVNVFFYNLANSLDVNALYNIS